MYENLQISKELKESLVILKMISNQLNYVNNSLIYLYRVKSDIINRKHDDLEVFNINTSMTCNIYYMMVWYISFLDEYKCYFSSSNEIEKVRIKDIKKDCKKYLKVVETLFINLPEARNQILAHGYRNKKNEALSIDQIANFHNQLNSYNDPNSYGQIANCVNLIVKEIEKIFGEIEIPLPKELTEEELKNYD